MFILFPGNGRKPLYLLGGLWYGWSMDILYTYLNGPASWYLAYSHKIYIYIFPRTFFFFVKEIKKHWIKVMSTREGKLLKISHRGVGDLPKPPQKKMIQKSVRARWGISSSGFCTISRCQKAPLPGRAAKERVKHFQQELEISLKIWKGDRWWRIWQGINRKGLLLFFKHISLE